MGWKKFTLILIALAAVVFVLLSVIPGGASIQNAGIRLLEWLLQALLWLLGAARFCLLLFILVLGAFLGGLAIRLGLMKQIDKRVEKERKISGGQHFLASILVGIIFAILQVVAVNIIFHDNPDVRQMFAWFGLGGPFETPSLLFIAYGFFAGMFGYLSPSI